MDSKLIYEDPNWKAPRSYNYGALNSALKSRQAGPTIEPQILPFPEKVTKILKNGPPSGDVQLQHAWNPEDRSLNLHVKNEDPFTMHRHPVAQSTDAILGKQAYSSGCHIWQIEWSENIRGTHAMVGVATQLARRHCTGYSELLGSDEQSWAWNMNSKKLELSHDAPPSNRYDYQRNLIKPTVELATVCRPSYPEKCQNWTPPNKVYCILDMDEGTLAYATENNYLGVAFEGLKGKTLFPAIGVVWGHAEVTMKYMGSNEEVKEPEGAVDMDTSDDDFESTFEKIEISDAIE